jgi:hypothetical protein
MRLLSLSLRTLAVKDVAYLLKSRFGARRAAEKG